MISTLIHPFFEVQRKHAKTLAFKNQRHFAILLRRFSGPSIFSFFLAFFRIRCSIGIFCRGDTPLPRPLAGGRNGFFSYGTRRLVTTHWVFLKFLRAVSEPFSEKLRFASCFEMMLVCARHLLRFLGNDLCASYYTCKLNSGRVLALELMLLHANHS